MLQSDQPESSQNGRHVACRLLLHDWDGYDVARRFQDMVGMLVGGCCEINE